MKIPTYRNKRDGMLHAPLAEEHFVEARPAGMRARIGRASEKVLSAWLGLAFVGMAALIIALLLFSLGLIAVRTAVAVSAVIPLILALAVLGTLWAAVGSDDL